MKKQVFKITSSLMAVVFNCLMAVAFSMVTGFDIVCSIIGINILGMMLYQIRVRSGGAAISGILMAGLVREVWLPKVMLKFRMDSRWLADCTSLDAFVSNGFLNLAEAGVDPDVVINYDPSSGPIGTTTSTEDSPLQLELYSISTKEDYVNVNIQETRQYDIMAVKTERHAKTIEQNILLQGAYNIAPAADGVTSPVVPCTGTLSGFRAATLDDVITLRQRFLTANMNNEEGVDEGQPVLVLHPTHLASLQAEDKLLFKKFVEQAPYLPFDLFGFKTYISTGVPRYNASTGAKVAFGSAPASTDTLASFAFMPGRAGRAQGDLKMFIRNNDPTYQAHVFNFLKRFFVGAIDGKGIGAIYSPNS